MSENMNCNAQEQFFKNGHNEIEHVPLATCTCGCKNNKINPVNNENV